MFKFKQKITGETGAHITRNVAIMVELKYLSNFWRNLEIWLINCEIILIITWSANCVISSATAKQAATFQIIFIKFYVLIVTLSIQDNEKLLQKLKTE